MDILETSNMIVEMERRVEKSKRLSEGLMLRHTYSV